MNGDDVKHAVADYHRLLRNSFLSEISTGWRKHFKCTDPACPFSLAFFCKTESKGIQKSKAPIIPLVCW
jgi:hypothetical protein